MLRPVTSTGSQLAILTLFRRADGQGGRLCATEPAFCGHLSAERRYDHTPFAPTPEVLLSVPELPTRSNALAGYGIAGTAREAELDFIVAEAARALGVPVAFLGFLDNDREWLKSVVGWSAEALPLACSFAAVLEDERDVMVIPDATSDFRLSSHPLVVHPPHIRFFAGAPIIDPDGHFLGALSVVDRAPHIITPEQHSILGLLGRQVVRELVARRDRLALQERLDQTDAALEESNDRFREFFERSSDLVMSIAPDARILHANEALLNTLGIERDQLSRTSLIRVVAPDERESFRTSCAEVFSYGQSRMIETVFVSSAGRRVTVEGTLQPKVIDGRAVLGRVIFRDISERKEFEAQLGNARDAALEAARLKTQFLTNVSHEIRTPMNGIVGMIDLLLSTQLNAEQQDFAYQARASAEQLLSIVNNILYVSNLEAGGLAASSVDFDLHRTLQRVVEVMKIAALGKDLNVSLSYDAQLPLIVRGNQSKLRQVITNLMENAVKFTEEGSVTLRVVPQTETPTHHVVRFEVRDTGIGIDAEDRLLLFEQFSQVEATSTRRFQGVGLGLATARHLVETMGGIIDVESTPGFGSTFWFSLPFPKQTGRRPIASSDLDFKGKRVLLADNYPTSRKIIRHYLETTWEMRVDLAGTAAEALDMLRRAAAAGDPFRAVVYETLPDADALTFARTVRGDPACSGTSLVRLVASSEAVNEEQMREAGINSYAVKPVGQGELFDAMTVALAHDAIPLARAATPVRDTPSNARVVLPEEKLSIRVLLAEDNFLNRKLTLSQLVKIGYQADAVANGKEAVEAVEKGDYAVILMDCQMPIMDGYQASMEIRRREASIGKRHRIIAMTANALEGDREKCLAAGMDDYLAKPTKHDELEAALARHFR
jgi:PAS domain S-box-containing protein